MSNSEDRTYKLICGYCRKESNDMNIIDDIISIIFEYQRSAKCSKEFRGDNIELSEDDSKATKMQEQPHGSIRADFCVKKGEKICLELESKIIHRGCNFIGVTTSKTKDYSTNPATSNTEMSKESYGIDDTQYSVYIGTGRRTRENRSINNFASKQVYTIKVIADWTGNQCKLTFFCDEIMVTFYDEKINGGNDDCTILLPCDDDIVLYPCVTPFNQGAHFVIRYA